MLLGLFLFWQIMWDCQRIGKQGRMYYNGIERSCSVLVLFHASEERRDDCCARDGFTRQIQFDQTN